MRSPISILLLLWPAMLSAAPPTFTHLPAGHYAPVVLTTGSVLEGEGPSTVIRVPANQWGVNAWGNGGTGEEGLGMPNRTVVRDLTIECTTKDGTYGLVIGTNVKVERVTVRGCLIGVVVMDSIGSVLRDSLLTYNYCNLYIPPRPVTTLTISGVNIRHAEYAGVLIQSGAGVRFTDNTIIESNKGYGLIADPRGWFERVELNGVWFENNPVHVLGAQFLTDKGSVYY